MNKKPKSIRVEVYQVQNKKNPKAELIATAWVPYVDEFTEEKDRVKVFETVWDLCNISCWLNRDYPTMYSNDGVQITFTSKFRGYCNEDIYLKSKWWFGVWQTLVYGWRQMSEDTAVYDIIHHCDTIR